MVLTVRNYLRGHFDENAKLGGSFTKLLHWTGEGDESVLLGDDFQTFNQHRCLLNTTFATVRAVLRAPSVRMFVFESKVHFTSLACSHIIRSWYHFLLAKRTKSWSILRQQKWHDRNSQRNLQVTIVHFFRIYFENCDRNSCEPQCTKQNFLKLFFIFVAITKSGFQRCIKSNYHKNGKLFWLCMPILWVACNNSPLTFGLS